MTQYDSIYPPMRVCDVEFNRVEKFQFTGLLLGISSNMKVSSTGRCYILHLSDFSTHHYKQKMYFTHNSEKSNGIFKNRVIDIAFFEEKFNALCMNLKTKLNLDDHVHYFEYHNEKVNYNNFELEDLDWLDKHKIWISISCSFYQFNDAVEFRCRNFRIRNEQNALDYLQEKNMAETWNFYKEYQAIQQNNAGNGLYSDHRERTSDSFPSEMNSHLLADEIPKSTNDFQRNRKRSRIEDGSHGNDVYQAIQPPVPSASEEIPIKSAARERNRKTVNEPGDGSLFHVKNMFFPGLFPEKYVSQFVKIGKIEVWNLGNRQLTYLDKEGNIKIKSLKIQIYDLFNESLVITIKQSKIYSFLKIDGKELIDEQYVNNCLDNVVYNWTSNTIGESRGMVISAQEVSGGIFKWCWEYHCDACER